MRQAINKLLGRKAPAAKDAGAGKAYSAVGGDSRAPGASIEDNSDNGIRRQMVQVVLRDCMRRHGIPARWIECRMMVVDSRSRGPGLYVRLVIRHWDERLLRYLFAFEAQLRAAITQFEPQASTWLHGMSWELDLRSSCPYPHMPDPASWIPAAPLATQAPAYLPESIGTPVDLEREVFQDLQDLHSMFAARNVSPPHQAIGVTRVDLDLTKPVDVQSGLTAGVTRKIAANRYPDQPGP